MPAFAARPVHHEHELCGTCLRQAAVPSASNDAIELEEDPSGLNLSPQNSGQNVLATAFSANGELSLSFCSSRLK